MDPSGPCISKDELRPEIFSRREQSEGLGQVGTQLDIFRRPAFWTQDTAFADRLQAAAPESRH